MLQTLHKLPKLWYVMIDVVCLMRGFMRTTLAIDDDVFAAAREMASTERKTIGEVISILARKSLRPAAPSGKTRNGVPLLAVRAEAQRVTSELVKQLAEELP